MDRQISQKVEFYRREEKRLKVYFDHFCHLLQLQHALEYIKQCAQFEKITQEGSWAKKGPRFLKISPL